LLIDEGEFTDLEDLSNKLRKVDLRQYFRKNLSFALKHLGMESIILQESHARKLKPFRVKMNCVFYYKIVKKMKKSIKVVD